MQPPPESSFELILFIVSGRERNNRIPGAIVHLKPDQKIPEKYLVKVNFFNKINNLHPHARVPI
jgi:hypothetical protein